MAEILDLFIMPHPPVIIPEIGKGSELKVEQTMNACNLVADIVAKKKPGTIFVVSPHSFSFKDCLSVNTTENLNGNFAKFGLSSLEMRFENNSLLSKEIILQANNNGIKCKELNEENANAYNTSASLDWGVLVPLYYINKQYRDFKLITSSVADLDHKTLYEYGKCIRKAFDSAPDERITVILSGDLSHVLKEDGPYGYNPMGEKLDCEILQKISVSDSQGILNINPQIIRLGRECGLRSIIIGLGMIHEKEYRTDILSYEYTFGIGYAVIHIEPLGMSGTKSPVSVDVKVNDIQEQNQYIYLAKQSLYDYFKNKKASTYLDYELPEEIKTTKAGVFVSIRKGVLLRGCIGTIEPTRKNIAEEIICNAISAATQDNRFKPITEEELPELTFSVDILSPNEEISTLSDLNPAKYGIIVTSGWRRGVLLPALEGIDSVAEQLKIALYKANIHPDEDYILERFTVERHGGK